MQSNDSLFTQCADYLERMLPAALWSLEDKALIKLFVNALRSPDPVTWGGQNTRLQTKLKDLICSELSRMTSNSTSQAAS